MTKIDVLGKKLSRAKWQIELLEKMIEDKTREAFYANDQLSRTVQSMNKLYRAMPSAMLVVNADGLIVQCNQTALRLLGYTEEVIIGLEANKICSEIEKITKLQLDVGKGFQEEHDWITANNQCIPMLVSASVLDDTDVFNCSYVFIASDLSDRKQMEMELRHSQKLESIGQLAAGVAHEINTPMQYIGDNVYFMQDSINDLLSLIALYRNDLSEGAIGKEKYEEILQAEEDVDLAYLQERTPKAAERTLFGVDRVNDIVSAMKAFSHPSNEKSQTDINAALETTLTVAKGEYKYVAELEKNLGSIPQVLCNAGDINQVFLNIIVNASHAIADQHTNTQGKISIATRATETDLVVEISDNGAGIPEHARNRIFEPFYTTKEVGRGTGQGLSLAYVVIVEKHQGKLYFKTECGVGTTFFIHLPIEQGR